MSWTETCLCRAAKLYIDILLVHTKSQLILEQRLVTCGALLTKDKKKNESTLAIKRLTFCRVNAIKLTYL